MKRAEDIAQTLALGALIATSACTERVITGDFASPGDAATRISIRQTGDGYLFGYWQSARADIGEADLIGQAEGFYSVAGVLDVKKGQCHGVVPVRIRLRGNRLQLSVRETAGCKPLAATLELTRQE